MNRPPLRTWSKTIGVAVPVTGGGSWLLSLAGVHRATAIVAAAALLAIAAIVTALPRIVESLKRWKASNLLAMAKVIEAKSDARSKRDRTKVESRIITMGMESAEKAGFAQSLLLTWALSQDRPEDRRFPDHIVDRHLPMPTAAAEEPSRSPERPGSPDGGGGTPDGGGKPRDSGGGAVVPGGSAATPRSDVSARQEDLLRRP